MTSTIAASCARAAHKPGLLANGMNMHAPKAPCERHAAEHCGACYASAQAAAERSAVRVLPQLLSAEQVQVCLEAAEVTQPRPRVRLRTWQSVMSMSLSRLSWS